MTKSKRTPKKPKPQNGRISPPTAAEILAKGGMTPRQIAAGQMGTAAERTARDMQIAGDLIANGAAVLQEQYNLSIEETAKWAQETLRRTRQNLKKPKAK